MWLVRAIFSRSFEQKNVDLHRRYDLSTISLVVKYPNSRPGAIVRIAPNEYSIDDLKAAAIIYRQRDSFIKARQKKHLMCLVTKAQQSSRYCA